MNALFLSQKDVPLRGNVPIQYSTGRALLKSRYGVFANGFLKVRSLLSSSINLRETSWRRFETSLGKTQSPGDRQGKTTGNNYLKKGISLQRNGSSRQSGSAKIKSMLSSPFHWRVAGEKNHAVLFQITSTPLRVGQEFKALVINPSSNSIPLFRKKNMPGVFARLIQGNMAFRSASLRAVSVIMSSWE